MYRLSAYFLQPQSNATMPLNFPVIFFVDHDGSAIAYSPCFCEIRIQMKLFALSLALPLLSVVAAAPSPLDGRSDHPIGEALEDFGHDVGDAIVSKEISTYSHKLRSRDRQISVTLLSLSVTQSSTKMIAMTTRSQKHTIGPTKISEMASELCSPV